MTCAWRRPPWRPFLLGLLLLAACAPEPPPAEPELSLRPVPFERLQGWTADDHDRALDAFRRSCEVIRAKPADAPLGAHPAAGRVADWQPVCLAAAAVGGADPVSARRFFETWFQPYALGAGERETGLFTGYYEPLLHGSRRFGGPYTVPLYRVPEDMIAVDLAAFDPELAGRRITGRLEDSRLVPYYSRAAIDAGALEGRDLELLWVDDPIDKFFLQIQGSGQVVLEDGSRVRVGYAGQNGHPYRAIGRDLIERGVLTPEEVSMQAIRAWLESHPDEAQDLMVENRSYIFFTERPTLGPDDGPLGAQGVPLTAGRSLAVDPRYVPLGAPVWLETEAPWPEGMRPFHHLMVAQDTGGAIKGMVRGDVFFGTGERAAATAGRMKSEGRLVVLLPRSLTPVG